MNDTFEIRKGLQVTLTFGLPKAAMVLDRGIMFAEVQRLIVSEAMRGVLSGNDVFKQVPFTIKENRYTTEETGQMDLEVYWQAHEPWWPATDHAT